MFAKIKRLILMFDQKQEHEAALQDGSGKVRNKSTDITKKV